MADYKVLAKGDYLRPQDFAPVTLKRYLFLSDGGETYLLLEFRNNREESLNGLSFTLTQYDAEGKKLYRSGQSAKVSAGAGETFVFEKLEIDSKCADFSVEDVAARFGVYSYSMRGGRLAVDYSTAPVPQPAPPPEKSAAKGFSVSVRKPKYPVAIGIFACITFLCLFAVFMIELFAYKETGGSFMKNGVIYSFENGIDVEWADVYVSGYRGRGNAVVPAEIEGHQVTYVSSYAFEGSEIESIRFEGSIRIEPNAFRYSDIRSVDFENVTYIGERAFYGCSNLREVRSSTVEAIGYAAFSDCTSLETVEIKGENRRISYIGDNSFEGCSSLRSVTIRPFLESVGMDLFSSCSGLEELSLRNYQYSETGPAGEPSVLPALDYLFDYGGYMGDFGLRTLNIGSMDCIPDYFCRDFASLERVAIGELRSPVIGESAFEGCTELQTVEIPAVTEVRYRAFAQSGLKSFDASKLELMGEEAFSGSDISSVSFGANDTLAEIPPYAFGSCGYLVAMTLPESVETIRYGAFSDCGELLDIGLPAGLKRIEESAFAWCFSLRALEIPAGIEYLGYGMLENCRGLSSLTMPFLGYSKDSPAPLSEFFGGSTTGLRTVALTAETVLADSAFSGCSNLYSVSLPDTLKEIGFYAFGGCSSLVSLYVPDSVQEIGYSAFSHCTSLESVDLPFLGVNAQKSCTMAELFGGGGYHESINVVSPELRSVRVRTGQDIPEGAFYQCEGLETIIYDQSIRTIGESAFYGCRSLTSFTLPEGAETIGAGAFGQCYRLYEVKNNSSLNIQAGSEANGGIGKYALAVYGANEEMPAREVQDGWTFAKIRGVRYLVGYPQRTSLSLPSGQSYRVAPYLFYNDDEIGNLSSTGSADGIEEYAFAQCYSLTQVTLSEGISSIGEGAFSTCDMLLEVTLPASLAEIGEDAFLGCRHLYEVWNLSSLPIAAGGAGHGGVAENALVVYSSADEPSVVVYDGSSLFMREGEEWKLISAEQGGDVWLYGYIYSEGNQIESFVLGKGFGNENITELHIPYEVTGIESGAFDGCTALTTIYYAGTQEEWKEIGGYAPAGCKVICEG